MYYLVLLEVDGRPFRFNLDTHRSLVVGDWVVLAPSELTAQQTYVTGRVTHVTEKYTMLDEENSWSIAQHVSCRNNPEVKRFKHGVAICFSLDVHYNRVTLLVTANGFARCNRMPDEWVEKELEKMFVRDFFNRAEQELSH